MYKHLIPRYFVRESLRFFSLFRNFQGCFTVQLSLFIVSLKPFVLKAFRCQRVISYHITCCLSTTFLKTFFKLFIDNFCQPATSKTLAISRLFKFLYRVDDVHSITSVSHCQHFFLKTLFFKNFTVFSCIYQRFHTFQKFLSHYITRRRCFRLYYQKVT